MQKLIFTWLFSICMHFYSEFVFEKKSKILIQKKIWNSYFSPFLWILDVYIVLNTNERMGLPVILKDHPI